jgi:hypothetical protein
MVVYDAASEYIRTGTNNKEKIEKIETVIEALELLMLESADKDNIDEYWLDDGQTKIKTVYRGVQSIMAAIMALEKLKMYYINRTVGRQVRLVDEKNFRQKWVGFKGS